MNATAETADAANSVLDTHAAHPRKSERYVSKSLGKCADGNFVIVFEKRENRAPAGQPPNELWVEWYRVDPKGDRTTVREAKLTPEKIALYRPWYDLWKAALAGDTAIWEGLALTEWPGIPIETAERFEATGIRSVEMLAAVSDADLRNLGTGARQYRDAAQSYITAKNNSKPIDGLRAQVNELRAQVETMSNQFAEGLALMQQIVAGGSGKKSKAA